MSETRGDAFGGALTDAAPATLAAKAKGDWMPMALLAVAAGVFISVGSIAFLVVRAVDVADGPVLLLSGAAFSVGLLMVMVTGAELFTGNAMFALPAATGELPVGRMLGAWALVWIGNFAGSLLIAMLFVAAGGGEGAGGEVGRAAIGIATTKVDKGAGAIFASGILANMLVCIAAWMAMGARSVPGKALAIVGPVTVFVSAGFEHSIANMTLLPVGAMLGSIDPGAMARNLVVSTLGNLVGGASVALLFGMAHRRIGR